MALIKCPGCGTEISERAEECPICGRTISKSSRDENMMKCYKCGRLIQRDISICPFCGYHYGTYKNKKMNEPREKKKGSCLKTVLIVFIVLCVIGAVFGEDDAKESFEEGYSEASSKDENIDLEVEEQEKADANGSNKITLESEQEQFKSGGYAYITNDDLSKYAVNMEGAKVYVVTQVDDMKDGIIQSTLDDGFMMSSFHVGNNYDKYSELIAEDDTVAIAGVVTKTNDYSFAGKSVELENCIIFAVGNEVESYRKDSTDESLSQYLVVTDEVANTDDDISKEDYKNLCQQLDYLDILRNPDSYDGKYCVVQGVVDQIIEGWFSSFTIFVVDGNGNKWGCTYSYKDGESHLLEGDSVVMYGKCNGVSNTETVLGKQVTLPHISIEYLD